MKNKKVRKPISKEMEASALTLKAVCDRKRCKASTIRAAIKVGVLNALDVNPGRNQAFILDDSALGVWFPPRQSASYIRGERCAAAQVARRKKKT